jgi:hypothetical protein
MAGFRLPSTPFPRPSVTGMKPMRDPLSGGGMRYRMNADARSNVKPVLKPIGAAKPFRYRAAFESRTGQ